MNLTNSQLTLLKKVAAADTGKGVIFLPAPCGRWRMDGTTYTVNDRTFQPLAQDNLVDVGDGRNDPVKVTQAGRKYLDAIASVAAWNADVRIGARVRYWTGARHGDGRISATRTRAQVLGGHAAVVWVDGEPSCIALTHVDLINDSREEGIS